MFRDASMEELGRLSKKSIRSHQRVIPLVERAPDYLLERVGGKNSQIQSGKKIAEDRRKRTCRGPKWYCWQAFAKMLETRTDNITTSLKPNERQNRERKRA